MTRSYRLFGSSRSDFLKKERYEDPYDLLEEDRYPDAFKPRTIKSSAIVPRKRNLDYVHYSLWRKQASKYVGSDSSNFYKIALNRKLVGINSIKRAVFGNACYIWVEIPNETFKRHLRRRPTFLAPYLPKHTRESPSADYLRLLSPNQLFLDEDNIIHQIPEYSIESSQVGGFYKVIISDGKMILRHPIKDKLVDVGEIEVVESDEGGADIFLGPQDCDPYGPKRFICLYSIVPIPKSIADRFDSYYSPYVLHSKRTHWLYVSKEKALEVLPLKRALQHRYWKFVIKPIEETLEVKTIQAAAARVVRKYGNRYDSYRIVNLVLKSLVTKETPFLSADALRIATQEVNALLAKPKVVLISLPVDADDFLSKEGLNQE